jgi:DNA (cytosine-5)-methyltransferase 1
MALIPGGRLPGALVVDLFAGGGGASSGIARAIGRDPDIAVNHDRAAIAMHAANHPTTRHYCESVFKVVPRKVCRGLPVGLLWASPDCTHHSKAKGGKPRKKKIRGLAWVVCRWAKEARPGVICLENVEEFADWGPLGPDDRPDKARRGQTFRAWTRKLERYGYRVEHRILVAADYGAPTTRRRLFLVARRDGKPILWPEPTHGKGRRKPWRTAAEIIDWNLPCPSIFERKRPLAEATQRRIAHGVMRYVVEAARPFIVPVKTWGGGGNDPRSIDLPMRTVTANKRGEFAIVSPTLVQTSYGERPDRWRCVPCGYVYDRADLPVCGCVKCGSEADPVLMPGQAPRVPGLHKPLGTVVAQGQKHALVAALLTKHYGGVIGHEVTRPTSTVTAKDHHALTVAHLTKFQQNSVGQDLREPLHTVMAGATRFAEVRAFLVKSYGTSTAQPVDQPLGTVTSRDRFALVTVDGVDYAIADIGMRMLVPRELFNAQGFDRDYIIDPSLDGEPLTKTAQVEKAGNSVPPCMAEALVRANLAGGAAREAA